MYACMLVCIYACVNICTDINTCTNINNCFLVFLSTYAYKSFLSTYAYKIRICTGICMYTYSCVYVHEFQLFFFSICTQENGVHVHTKYVYVQAYACTYIHVYMYMNSNCFSPVHVLKKTPSFLEYMYIQNTYMYRHMYVDIFMCICT